MQAGSWGQQTGQAENQPTSIAIQRAGRAASSWCLVEGHRRHPAGLSALAMHIGCGTGGGQKTFEGPRWKIHSPR